MKIENVKKGGCSVEEFTAAGKEIFLFPAEKESAPLVLMHAVGEEGPAVYRKTKELCSGDFSFAVIAGIDCLSS